MVVGWQLAAVGGCHLAVGGGWRLAAVGGCQLAVGGGWWLMAVGDSRLAGGSRRVGNRGIPSGYPPDPGVTGTRFG